MHDASRRDRSNRKCFQPGRMDQERTPGSTQACRAAGIIDTVLQPREGHSAPDRYHTPIPGSGTASAVDGHSDDYEKPVRGSDQIALARLVQARHCAVRTSRTVRRLSLRSHRACDCHIVDAPPPSPRWRNSTAHFPIPRRQPLVVIMEICASRAQGKTYAMGLETTQSPQPQ
jgi:hypothetical protein